MRTLVATLAIGAVAGLALSQVATSFLPGFGLGMAYMLAAALFVNSRQGAR